MLENKSSVTDIKNVFDRLTSKLDEVKETTNEGECRSIKLTQTETQVEKNSAERNQRKCGAVSNSLL